MISLVRLIVNQRHCLSVAQHFLLSTKAMAAKSDLIDVKDKRVPYKSGADVLLEKDVDKEPIKMFTEWFTLANNTPGILEANAMHLATSSKLGVPSGRFVLMKSFSEDGFVFFTNYDSRKGKELIENPQCALTFYWEPLKRSVRIEGKASEIDAKDSDSYFESRPYDSKIGALASDQSRPVESRAAMLDIVSKLREKYPQGSHIPRPAHWGGFKVAPESMEFWQGQSDRVHDRFLFTRKRTPRDESSALPAAPEWSITRLFP